jgi:hypothetical protein
LFTTHNEATKEAAKKITLSNYYCSTRSCMQIPGMVSEESPSNLPSNFSMFVPWNLLETVGEGRFALQGSAGMLESLNSGHVSIQHLQCGARVVSNFQSKGEKTLFRIELTRSRTGGN